MGVLDRFEKGVERAVSTPFSKAFHSDLKPVEIASALRREVDDRAVAMDRDRTIVPNEFTVELSPADQAQMLGWGAETLADEFAAKVSAPQPSIWAWSAGDSSTVNSFGTMVRSRSIATARSSTSRRNALAISTGLRSLWKAFAN